MNQTYEPHELPGVMCTALNDVFPRGWLLVFTHPEGETAEGIKRERVVCSGMIEEDSPFMEWHESVGVAEQWGLGSVIEAGGQGEELCTYEKKVMSITMQRFNIPKELRRELCELLPRGWLLFYALPVVEKEDGSRWLPYATMGSFADTSVMRVWADKVMTRFDLNLYEHPEDGAEAGEGTST